MITEGFIWKNHPVTKHPNPWFIDHDYSDLDAGAIGSIVGGATNLGGAIINATTSAKTIDAQKKLLQMQIDASLAAINANSAVSSAKAKQYATYAIIGIVIIAIAIAGWVLLKKKKII
ncbi:MAG: LPXTG cell wall anchor domain-containing protein [Candidatus Nanoarchaeia archaeon]|nr:LPXTG cell wall anchor domain-containing protein [Candidatus Nanoarchaeia archaeon]